MPVFYQLFVYFLTSTTATSLCFNEKNIYTQEVLAVVMKELVEFTPLPMLLMRTVIQSLTMYQRLSGLVMNILQMLIGKSVWTQPRVWEGFIKCCEVGSSGVKFLDNNVLLHSCVSK